MGTGYWSPRPLLIALVLFAVAGRHGRDRARGRPGALVPLMWVWLNVHGSWPSASATSSCGWWGAASTTGPSDSLPRRIAAAVAGCALGVLNPFGWRLVAYPLRVITQHAAFAHIVEWQSPSFSDPVNVVFLVEALVAVVLLVARRGTVEDALVTVVFIAAALLASRNVPVAALVMAPVLARRLGRARHGRRGRPKASFPPWRWWLALVGALLVAGAVRNPAWNFTDTRWPKCRGCRATTWCRAGWPPPTTSGTTSSSATGAGPAPSSTTGWICSRWRWMTPARRCWWGGKGGRGC